MLTSPDGASVFLLEAYLAQVDASVYSLRALSLDVATGAQSWFWSPEYTLPSAFPYPFFLSDSAGLVLSADGLTLFVICAQTTTTAFFAAISTASGAVLWKNEVPSFSFTGLNSYTLGVALPAVTASGELCYATNMAIVCADPATGVARYTIALTGSQSAVALDPSLNFITTTEIGEDGGVSTFTAYSALTGTLLWTFTTAVGTQLPSNTNDANTLTSTALFFVAVNMVANSASVFAISLELGTLLPGFPTVLPSSLYIDTFEVSATPSGALLFSRFISDVSFSLALVSAVTGEELWVFSQPEFSARGTVFSADGTAVFLGGSCTDDVTPCAPGSGATLSVVSLASGERLSAVTITGSYNIGPIKPDPTTGGAVIMSLTEGNEDTKGGSSLETVTTLGVTAGGVIAWATATGMPAPARESFFAGFSVASRSVFFFDSSRANDFTCYLSCFTLPAPASSSSMMLGALLGGVLGGAALLAAAAFIFVRRATIFNICAGRRSGAERDEPSDATFALLAST